MNTSQIEDQLKLYRRIIDFLSKNSYVHLNPIRDNNIFIINASKKEECPCDTLRKMCPCIESINEIKTNGYCKCQLFIHNDFNYYNNKWMNK